jgi:ribose/xylose/arabinose/galactoside ABC-type transport system permease subunit
VATVADRPSPTSTHLSLRRSLQRNRPALGAFGFFVVMMAAFTVAAPEVFTQKEAYTAVFVSLPILMILAVSLVFVITLGEIDLSFPSIVGLTALVFALCVQAGLGPWLALVPTLAVGVGCGLLNGILVTYLGLSSLVVTLGMNFLLRGIIQIKTQGLGIPLDELQDTTFWTLFVGDIDGFPVQMFWGLGFAIVAFALFARHRFGAHVKIVGDNAEAAREMGVNTHRVKIAAFVFVGVAASLAGVLSVLINLTFFPTTGDGYLLPVLAAVFVGGTPTWGGTGTIAGAVAGAATVGFIETGLIAAGLTSFYTQFFYGLVIVLSLVGHQLRRPSARRRPIALRGRR